MNIIVYDPAADRSDEASCDATPVGFEAILRQSDYLCVSCPLLPDTREMIKMDQLKMMKPTAVLINTSRGGLINEKHLAQALHERVIRYAAVDVFENINVFDPNGIDTSHPLFSAPNLIMTPHVAADSSDSLRVVAQCSTQAVCDVLTGKKPQYAVNIPDARQMEVDR